MLSAACCPLSHCAVLSAKRPAKMSAPIHLFDANFSQQSPGSSKFTLATCDTWMLPGPGACCMVCLFSVHGHSVLHAVCCATVQPSASGSPPDAMAQPPTGLIDSATKKKCLHFRFHRSTSAAEVRLAREHARATKAAAAVVCEAAGLCRRYLSRVGPTVVAAILGPCAAVSFRPAK